jgi:hypothetical protein
VTGNHSTFTGPILAEHLFDRTSGAIHWFLGFMNLGFSGNS